MNAPWNGRVDDDYQLDRRLRELDDHLVELFTACRDDPRQLATFRDLVDRRAVDQDLARMRSMSRQARAVPSSARWRSGGHGATRHSGWFITIAAGIGCLAVLAALALRALPMSPAAINGSGVGALEKPDLKFSLMATTDLAPFWLAVQNGYFRDAGFTFDPQRDVTIAQTGTDSVAKLATGQADIAYSSYAPFFVAQSRGTADIKLVADASSAGPSSCMVVSIPGRKISSVRDMAGARVAITARNTISELLVASALKTKGVDYTKVKWVELPFPEMAGALASGAIDAAFVTEPYLSEVRGRVGAMPVFDTAVGPTVELPTAGFGANAEFVAKYPRTVAAFQNVMERATTEAKADRTKVEKLLQEAAHIDAETARLASLLTFQSTLDPTRIQRVTDLMLEFGMIGQRIEASEIIAKPPPSR
jgi:NitT/TauT family transport system substrate-binding protein